MTYTTKTGNSLTVGILMPTYSIEDARSIVVYLNNKVVQHTVIDQMIRVELSSEYTSQLYGMNPLVLIVDDLSFGVRKKELGNIEFSNIASTFKNTSINEGYNVTFVLEVNETEILITDVLYEYVKGRDGAENTHEGETINPDVVQFGLNPTTPTEQGSQYWDAAYKVLSTVLGDGVILQNGLEMYVRIVNKTGVEIADGKVLYINGAQGNRPTAALAIATNAASANVIGVATQNIPINSEGFVTVFGNVSGFNTSGYGNGANMYLSATIAGGMTPTEPLYPHHKVIVATALNSTNNGQIFVRPVHVMELAELHGIDLTETTPLATDSILIQQTSTGKVKKSLLSTIITFLSNAYFATLKAGSVDNYSRLDINGLKLFGSAIQYRDEYTSSSWVSAAGSAAPDQASYTIGGVQINMYSFDGNNTEEKMSNMFEIPHDAAIDSLNADSDKIEFHIHGMASNNGSGVVRMFFDWCYVPVNDAPIPQVSISVDFNILANSQFVHKINGAELPKPSGGYNIGDKILFSVRRTPTNAADTYTSDFIFSKCALHVPVDSLGSESRYVK